MTSGASAWLIDQRWFKAYPLSGETTTIGRGPDSTIILRDPAVSRTHAEVRQEGADYTLRVLGSSGTNVNGVRVDSSCKLNEGDLIEIAFSGLRFTTRAPTGEMFVVPRDVVVTSDRHEVPTRATLHSMHPITLASRAKQHWHFVLVALLVLLVIAICAERPV